MCVIHRVKKSPTEAWPRSVGLTPGWPKKSRTWSSAIRIITVPRSRSTDSSRALSDRSMHDFRRDRITLSRLRPTASLYNRQTSQSEGETVNRRDFLSGAAAAGAAAWVRPGAARPSPNDVVNVAIIGMRGESQGQPTWTRLGRGQDHYAGLSGVKNARIAYVVDIDERHLATVVPKMKARYGGDPKTETDVRKVLESRDVDAITVAVPDHWHALMTIWACQAGKDVYVEKPVCHSLFEGRKMVEAARKYKRVVQAGTQRRTSELTRAAVKFLESGGLGKLYSARCAVLRPREPIGRKPDGAAPQGVNYDLWLGPAPKRPFNELRFHYTWHWFWDYGTADLGNNGVHVLDILRFAMGKREHPQRIHCTGG